MSLRTPQILCIGLAFLGIALLLVGNIVNDIQIWYIIDVINAAVFVIIIVVLYGTLKK